MRDSLADPAVDLHAALASVAQVVTSGHSVQKTAAEDEEF